MLLMAGSHTTKQADLASPGGAILGRRQGRIRHDARQRVELAVQPMMLVERNHVRALKREQMSRCRTRLFGPLLARCWQTPLF